MGGTVPEGHVTRMSPGVWGPQRPMLPNFRSPSRDPIGGLPLSAVAACPRHSSHHQQQRKSSTMDGDKKRLFLERMRASPFHNQIHSQQQKSKTNKAGEAFQQHQQHLHQQQLPVAKGTSTGVEILTDDEIGLTCSNGLGPPAFFDLGGSTPLGHTPSSVKSRHFLPQHQQQQQQQQRYGFRSLSGDGRGRKESRPLFGGDDLDDSPLLMSSIDGVTTQAGARGEFMIL
jgi:hypothetical protein